MAGRECDRGATRLRRAASAAIVAALLCVGQAARAEVPLRCAMLPVTVSGGEAADREAACEGAVGAHRFLSTVGLALDLPVSVRVVAQIESGLEAPLSASYGVTGRVVTVLDYAALAAVWTARGVPGITMSRVLQRSLVAHEFAHAIAEPRFAKGVPRPTASEYLASVTQIAMLPQADRETLLRRYARLRAYGHESEVSMTFYLLDPWAFGVKAYRHFLSLEDPPGFVAWLLANGFTTDRMGGR